MPLNPGRPVISPHHALNRQDDAAGDHRGCASVGGRTRGRPVTTARRAPIGLQAMCDEPRRSVMRSFSYIARNARKRCSSMCGAR